MIWFVWKGFLFILVKNLCICWWFKLSRLILLVVGVVIVLLDRGVVLIGIDVVNNCLDMSCCGFVVIFYGVVF